MIRALFVKESKASLVAAGGTLVSLVACVALIVGMFNPATAAQLEALQESMPGIYDAFGMGRDTTTLTGFLLNYLYGFLLTACPLVLVLLLVNRMVVRPLATGEAAWLLASPHRRTAIMGTLAATVGIVLVGVLVLTAVSEVACILLLYPADLEFAALVRVNAGLLALWVFMAGVCLLSACAFSAPGAALWVGGSACILEYLVQMVSQASDSFAAARFLTFFTLFDPYGLAAGDVGACVAAAALGVAGIACAVLAVGVFARRDLVL